MRDAPQETNARRCKCADCRAILEKGQGVRHIYDMFHGRGQYYYCCPECDAKREAERVKDAATRQSAMMDREARAQGVDYE